MNISCAKDKSGDPTADLHALFAEYHEDNLKRSPQSATALGDKRYDSLLGDLSAKARESDFAATRSFLNQLKAIDRYKLSNDDRVSYDILARKLQFAIDGEKFKFWSMPIDKQGGPHMELPDLTTQMTFTAAQDYSNYISRLRAFPRYISQTIDNMREGMSQKLTPARINVVDVPSQIATLIVDDPSASPLYEPFQANNAKLDSATLAQLSADAAKAIAQDVMPAYRSLSEFLTTEYIPVCREEYGLWSLPDGAERYAYLINYHTSLPLKPEEITATGQTELVRIHAEMDDIIKKVGFKGDRKTFLTFLHTDKRFYYTNADSLVAGYTKIMDSITTRMPEQFGVLPKAACFVKVIESFRAPTTTTAYYNPSARDGSRPGYFYVNTHALESRPRYEMEALSYHEAIPGHHLQIAIAQEMENLPEFRKNDWITAFGEGWALYSERLPKELGFYSDPYSDFGRLIYDAWRASRLVVDCGIHYYKWDRQKAIDFMVENYGGSLHNIEVEVDRYIAWPGQALGYKIGQLKILELRTHAQTELGAKFDIREFHDQVLGSGCIPLEALEKKINEWIATKKNS